MRICNLTEATIRTFGDEAEYYVAGNMLIGRAVLNKKLFEQFIANELPKLDIPTLDDSVAVLHTGYDEDGCKIVIVSKQTETGYLIGQFMWGMYEEVVKPDLADKEQQATFWERCAHFEVTNA